MEFLYISLMILMFIVGVFYGGLNKKSHDNSTRIQSEKNILNMMWDVTKRRIAKSAYASELIKEVDKQEMEPNEKILSLVSKLASVYDICKIMAKQRGEGSEMA